MKARKCSLSALKDLLAFAGNIGPGVDRTGLIGAYDFTLSWSEEDGLSLASALRGQLGLQTEEGEGAAAQFVLASAQKITPNNGRSRGEGPYRKLILQRSR